jgi:sporulation protein YqfC
MRQGGIFVSLKDRKKRFQQQFANILDIPGDIMMDLPKIILVGDVQLFIENHRGIMVYTATQVRINTSIGELQVDGVDLTLRNILPDEITVEGRITSVAYRC